MLVRALLMVAALLGKEGYSQEFKQFKKNKDQLNQICNLTKEEALGLIARGLISTEKLNRYLRICADKPAPLELDLSNMNLENSSRSSQGGVLEPPVVVQPSSESPPFVQGKGSLRQSDKEQRSQPQEASVDIVMICCKKREYSYLKYCRGMVNQMVAIPRLEYLWLQSKTQQQSLPEKQIVASH